MSAYGSFKYGDGTLYGETVPEQLKWGVEIDWDGDGVFDGSNEAARVVDLQITRGRDFYIRLDGNDAVGFEYMRAGKAFLTLDNTDDRYNPFNTLSPLYPNVIPGKYIKIRVRVGTLVYPLFAGTVQDIQVVPGQEQVRLSCVDGMQWLADRDADVSLQTTIGIDDAVNLILTAANWPSVWGTDVQATSETLAYWWTRNRRALQELNDLADAELGLFFCAADGKAKFITRNYGGSSAATITQSEALRNINLPQPWEVIRNWARVVAHPRILQADLELWRLNEVPQIPSGTSITRWASYSYNGEEIPATTITEPVATTDYTANSDAGGLGTDYTANITITRTTVNGTTSKFVIANSGPTAYITLLKLRGTGVIAPNAFAIVEEDTSSQAIYGKKKITIDSDWLQDGNKAQEIADWLIGYLPSALYFPILQLESRPEYQFSADLYDVVNFASAKLGIAANDYRVGYIEHKWLNSNGQAVLTTWKLETTPDIVGGYWVFPTQIGTSSIFGL